jgi:hypothetical protein
MNMYMSFGNLVDLQWAVKNEEQLEVLYTAASYWRRIVSTVILYV